MTISYTGRFPTGPTKCKKKTSCACTSRTGHVMHSLGGMTYFLSRQRDIKASHCLSVDGKPW